MCAAMLQNHVVLMGLQRLWASFSGSTEKMTCSEGEDCHYQIVVLPVQVHCVQVGLGTHLVQLAPCLVAHVGVSVA